MTDKANLLKAELAVAEAEQLLIDTKEKFDKGKVSETVYRGVKDEVRKARQAYREARDSGTANPETVALKAAPTSGRKKSTRRAR